MICESRYMVKDEKLWYAGVNFIGKRQGRCAKNYG